MNCRALLWFALAPMLAGCTLETKVACHPVRGQILINDKPAHGFTVVLNQTGVKPAIPMQPNGVVQADGTFTISTYGNNDGAPVGEYRITLLYSPDEREEAPPSIAPLRDRLANSEKPIAMFTVREGENEIPVIKLK